MGLDTGLAAGVALGGVASSAGPGEDGGEEMEKEPAGGTLVEVDEVEDQDAGKDEPDDGRQEAGEVEGAEAVFEVGDEQGEAREEEGDNEEEEGEVVDGEGHLRVGPLDL